MNAPQGTAGLLALSDALARHVECVQGGYHLGESAKLMEQAAIVIHRLAPLEPDIEVEHGDN